MDATVRATCPKCRTALRIPSEWVGQAVKCKKCGAVVRSKLRSDCDTPRPSNTGTAEAAPLDQTVPFVKPPAPRDDDPFPLPEPIAPPQAQPQPAPAYPYPAPPGYPPPGVYAPPPGYHYAPPPGYPYPVPAGAYAPPPGYPYPVPPGYGYPVPPGMPPIAMPVPAQSRLDPVPPSNEFRTEPSASPTSTRRYRRSSGKSKFVWIGFCLLLTGGLITAGVLGMNYLNEKNNKKEQVEGDTKPDGTGPSTGPGPSVPKAGPFPRRLLFISLTKYMYLNPLTATQGGVDRSKPSAQRLQFDWRVPIDKDNNQLFVLSDTTTADAPIPVKSVVMGAYERFFETSREQDRIAIYFGGHALEKDGKAYLAPIEGELEDVASLIPLDEFYAKLKDCKATQKVVIWDVCRFNPDRGKQRPGSDPMSPTLAKALASAPAGIEVITTCQPGENALEFNSLQTDPAPRSPTYAGSAFLESVRYVGEKNKSAKAPTPADPLPVGEWATAIGKRVNEMASLPVVGLKQSVKIDGKPRAELVAPKEEAAAKRFEMPTVKATSGIAIKSIEREFVVPPIKSDLADGSLADLPYAESVQKDYAEDVPIKEVLKNKDNYKLRAATIDAFEVIRELWAGNPGDGGPGKLEEEIKAPITDDIKKRINAGLEFYAIGIAKLELINITLDEVAGLKAGETKRWQAHYEYARAVVKSRLAYLNEYNKLMGDVRTETMPFLDKTLGQDMYRLASSEKMKSRKEIQKLAEESQEAYAKLITEHKGTPWALQSKRDRAFSLGLVWRPVSSKKDE